MEREEEEEEEAMAEADILGWEVEDEAVWIGGVRREYGGGGEEWVGGLDFF